MTKEFITYEQSLELKELGFDEPCLAWYVSAGGQIELGYVEKNHLLKDAVMAPLYQQVFRWFEEKYSLYVDKKTYSNVNEFLGTDYYITSWKLFTLFEVGTFLDRNEGENDCVKELINIIKKNKNGN
jgi:hypothetical protein